MLPNYWLVNVVSFKLGMGNVLIVVVFYWPYWMVCIRGGGCVLLWRMWFNLFLTVLDIVQYKSFEWPLCSIVIGCEH